MSTFNTFMTALIDYAGLFPPAQLDMSEAMAEYERRLALPESWVVGRFICPVARFDELMSSLGDSSLERVEVSALIGVDLRSDLERIAELIADSQDRIDVPAIELKVTDVAQFEEALDILDPDDPPCRAFMELPASVDPRGLIAALAGTAHGAKIRTGGVSAGLFPPPRDVARFIAACRDARVPFKATAGMHHPTRTPAPAIGATMYGFFNVFLAAIAAVSIEDFGASDIEQVLMSEGADWFEFTEDHVTIHDLVIPAEDVEIARAGFAISFGSCSIAEPVEDLQRLDLLPTPSTK